MFLRILCSILVSGIFLSIYLRDNAFPYFYHTDEPSKVEQILTGHRNGRHPALLLNSASIILKLSGWTPTRDHAARAGRVASAIFVAAMLGLVWIVATNVGGWLAGAVCVLFVGLHPPLLESAHFVKEDPALLLGILTTILAAQIHEKNPGGLRTFFLGAGAGLALSGKWIGITAILVGSILLWYSRKQLRPRDWILFVLGVISVFALTNITMFQQWNVVEDGLSKEVVSFYTTDTGGKRSFNLSHYAGRLPEVFPWPLILLAFGGFWQIWRQSSPIYLRAISVFPFAWFLMISCIPKTEDRYLLPVATFFGILAGLAARDWLRFTVRRKWLLWASATILGLLVVGWLIPRFRDEMAGFQHDHRREMATWIRSNLPPNAVIAEDTKVGLPTLSDPRFDAGSSFLPQAVLSPQRLYASDYGTLEQLREKGVTHVALFPSNYLVLLERGGVKANTAQKEKAARFFTEIQSQGKRVFRRNKGENRYLNPALALYDIHPAKS